MWLTNFAKKISQNRRFSGLYDPTRFAQALDRERARADRWGHTLSMVSLGANDPRHAQATLRQVVRILRERMRLTDEAGWLDHGQIGLLLPNTPSDGAWTVAEKICEEFPPEIPRPNCRVYTYPSDWILEEGNPEDDSTEPASANQRRTEAMEPLFVQGLPLWKRAIDVAASGLGLLMCSPFLLGLAALVKLTSPGPIFFKQARVGLGGKLFTMYKFRTMVVNAERLKAQLQAQNEQEGPVFKIKNDPRITSIGRFLRKSSLDELPQLWNVFTGDMSLVGPRPPIYSEVVQYEPWQRGRLFVTPGLTCIWQVRGRSKVGFTDWMRMDLQYIAERSLWSDMKLLLATIPAIITGRGAC